MNIVTGPEAQQGSAEWLARRLTRITASDMPAVMGTSIFSTAYALWRQKIGLDPPIKDNPAIRHGRRTEPLARVAYEDSSGELMVPMVGDSDKVPYIMASLDGLSFGKKKVLEIKCPISQTTHQWALDGMVPPYYEDQIQTQLFVSDTEVADYFSYFQGSGVIVEVARDQDRINQILDTAAEFYDRMQKKVWSSDDWAAAASDWLTTNLLLEEAKEREARARAALVGLLGEKEPKREGAGVLVTRVTRKGSVDYDAFFASKGLVVDPAELEPFRKESSEGVQVRAAKKAENEPTPTKGKSKAANPAAMPKPKIKPMEVPADFVLTM